MCRLKPKWPNVLRQHQIFAMDTRIFVPGLRLQLDHHVEMLASFILSQAESLSLVLHGTCLFIIVGAVEVFFYIHSTVCSVLHNLNSNTIKQRAFSLWVSPTQKVTHGQLVMKRHCVHRLYSFFFFSMLI